MRIKLLVLLFVIVVAVFFGYQTVLAQSGSDNNALNNILIQIQLLQQRLQLLLGQNGQAGNSLVLRASEVPGYIFEDEQFQITCDYGEVLPCITPLSEAGVCEFDKFNGTAATFNCRENAVSRGEKKNYCTIFSYSRNPKCKPQKTQIQSTTVTDATQPSLTVALDGSNPAAGNIPAGQVSTLAVFKLTAASFVQTITGINMDIIGTTSHSQAAVTSLKLIDKSTNATLAMAPGRPDGSIYFSGLSLIVPANTTKALRVDAAISSNAMPGTKVGASISSASSISASQYGGRSNISGSFPVSGNIMTVAGIAAQPTITVTSPNGGTYKAGDIINIQWQPPANAQLSDKLYIMIQNYGGPTGDGNIPAISATSNGTYSYTVPASLLPGSMYKVAVSGVVNGVAISGNTANYFTIAAAGTTTCTPSWQTGSWSACVSGQQTRTVTDSNNCGVATNMPATSQACTASIAAELQIQPMTTNWTNNTKVYGSDISIYAPIKNIGSTAAANVRIDWYYDSRLIKSPIIASVPANSSFVNRAETSLALPKPAIGSHSVKMYITFNGIRQETSLNFTVTPVSTASISEALKNILAQLQAFLAK